MYVLSASIVLALLAVGTETLLFFKGKIANFRKSEIHSVAIVCVVIITLLHLYGSKAVIEDGQMALTRNIYGRIDYKTPALLESTRINPYSTIVTMNIKHRVIFRAAGGNHSDNPHPEALVSADGGKVAADLTLPYEWNNTYAGRIRSAFASEEDCHKNLMVPSAKTALGAVCSKFSREYLLSTDLYHSATDPDACEIPDGGFFPDILVEHFRENVVVNLAKLPQFEGLSKNELLDVFGFGDADVGMIFPYEVVARHLPTLVAQRN